MADHASAIKRARQSKRRHLRNKAVLTGIKSMIKKLNGALTAKKMDEASILLVKTTSALDSAGNKGVIPRNTASRRVSRLTSKVKKGLAA
ncbi:MAG TPA: 30S ribosomal protein S20 [Nitrospiria bacterium]